jgi:exo-1,4-beta-D-glucosaminidase
MYDMNMKELFAHEAEVGVEADAVKSVVTLPPFSGAPGAVYFLDLRLLDAQGKTVSSNFYWLPATLSTLEWDSTHATAYTPIATHEDLTALQQLPRVRLQAFAKHVQADRVQVTIKNPSRNLAFQVHLAIADQGSKEQILPVMWDDNYVPLLPGESRVITARYRTRDAVGSKAVLRVDGWNVEQAEVPITMPPRLSGREAPPQHAQ